MSDRLNQARVLWASKQYVQALKVFDECLKYSPDDVQVLIDTARVRGQWYDHPEMERHLEHLLALFPRHADIELQVGMTYRMNYRPHEALKHLRQAVRTRKNHTIALLELAVLCERMGKLDEAGKAADKCIKSAPTLPEALAVKSRVLLRSRKSKEALRLLTKLEKLPDGNISPDTKAYVLSEIAKQKEKGGDFKGAMETRGQAKEVLAPAAQPLIEDQELNDPGITSFYQKLERGHLEKWTQGPTQEGLPKLCLMTSFPRSGTTLLECLLGNHPNVVASDEMEVFTKRIIPELVGASGGESLENPDHLDKLDDRSVLRLQETYFKCQENALGQPLQGGVLIDKNPSFTVFIPLFLKVFPDAKILVPLRDPRDVVLSCYAQYFPVNPFSINFLDLEKAAQRYAHDMKIWTQTRSSLPSGQWYEISYEKLTENAELETKQVCDFLGVSWVPEILDHHQSSQTLVHNAPTYADARHEIYRGACGRWRNYEEYMEPLKPILEPIMNELGYSW